MEQGENYHCFKFILDKYLECVYFMIYLLFTVWCPLSLRIVECVCYILAIEQGGNEEQATTCLVYITSLQQECRAPVQHNHHTA